MALRGNNLPVWIISNAWREILTRIFEDFEVRFNVSPEWLVNPLTNRRLKLDMLYPHIGVAVRLEGLQSKQRKSRPSLEEEAQLRARLEARLEVCRRHGIHLILVDLIAGKPQAVFKEIDAALSRAEQSVRDKKLRPKIKKARATAAQLGRKILLEQDLKLYAELWEDRQYRLAEPAPVEAIPKPGVNFTKGMEVEHAAFGPGVVLATQPSNGDTLITVDFITAGVKTLAASLVVGKLLPR